MTEDEAKRLEAIVEEVRAKFPDTIFPNVCLTHSWYGRKAENVRPKPGRRDIMGWFSDDPDFTWSYHEVSEHYKIAHHEEAIARTMQVLEKMPEYGKPAINIHLYDGTTGISSESESKPAARMLMDIKFPEVQFEVKKGDLLNPELKGFNSYDLKWEFGYQFWAYQLVCSNGLVAPKCLDNVRQKHRLNLDIDSLTEQIGEGLGKFSDQIGLWKQWAQLEMPSSKFDNVFEKVPNLSDTRIEAIKQLTSVGTGQSLNDMLENERVNLWDAYSIVTQYLTHEVDAVQVQLDTGNAIARSFQRAAESLM